MNKIFSKDKDWVLLIGYVALIYATLPIMPKITSFCFSLLGGYFGIVANIALVAGIFIIFAIIFKSNLAPKNLLFYIAITALLASYLAILFFATPIVAEKMHLLEYGFLSYLALRAVKSVRSTWKRYLCVVFIIILAGYCDELIQKFTPGRFYETKDVALNIISGILGLFILKLRAKPEYC